MSQSPPITATVPPLISDLHPSHIPTPGSNNRLIIVGDVHGQLAPLERLLSKANFRPADPSADPEGGTDHLIFVGDIINKGPDSAGVVALAQRLGASSVRGNHEDKVLGVHAEYLAHRRLSAADAAAEALASLSLSGRRPTNPIIKELTERAEREGKPLSKGTLAALKTATELADGQLAWLAARPLILRITFRAEPAQTLLVVHGGLVPRAPLPSQDRWSVMHMRTLLYPSDARRVQRAREAVLGKLRREMGADALSDGGLEDHHPWVVAEVRRMKEEDCAEGDGEEEVPAASEHRDGREGWDVAWNRWMRALEERQRAVVVYGHDAKKGLAVGGLDVEGEGRGLAEQGGEEEVGYESGRKKEKKKCGKKDGGKKRDKSRPDDDGDGEERWTYGLDTGAVYGRQLSALIIEVGEDGELYKRVVQVDCEKAIEPNPGAILGDPAA